MVNLIQIKTGITQRAMAAYIGADFKTLSKHNKGKRILSAQSIVELTALYTHSAKSTNTERAKPNIKEKQQLLKAANWCNARCYPLQKKLEKTTRIYNAAANALVMLNSEAFIATAQTERRKRWIEEQRYQAQQKVEANGWALQHKLLTAIAILQHEASIYNKAAEESN